MQSYNCDSELFGINKWQLFFVIVISCWIVFIEIDTYSTVKYLIVFWHAIAHNIYSLKYLLYAKSLEFYLF